MEQRALLTAVSWTGAVSSDWDTAGNWSDAAVPGANDDVTINVAMNTPVTHAQNDTDAINSLTSTEPISIPDGSLSIAAASTISSSLSMTGGTLTGMGAITVGGLLTLTTGTISGSGNVNADGGMTLNPAVRAMFVIDGRTIINASGQTATCAGVGGAIEMSDGAMFNNLGTFQSQNADPGFSQGAGAASSFNNDGTFTVSVPSVFSGPYFDVPFNVAGGTVDVQSGDLVLEGGGTDTNATFTSAEGGEIDFGGTVTLDSASSIGGAGTVTFGEFVGGTMSVAGTYDVTGVTVGGGGTTMFTGTVSSIGDLTSDGGTLDFTTAFPGTAGTIGAVVFYGGTVNLGSNALDATTLNLVQGGTLTGTGTITVSGLMTLNDGTISGSGAVNADGGILIEPDEDPLTLDGRPLTNAAGQTATWAENDEFDFVMLDGAAFNNLGTFLFQSGGSFVHGTGASSSFNNQGSLTASTNDGVVTFGPGVSFNVEGGTVNLQTGTVLDLQGGGTNTGATYTIESGTTVDFEGTTPFVLDSASTFNGAGTLTKDGPTTLSIPGNSPSFTGPTTVRDGTLLVDGSLAGSAVSVENGATVGGTGTVGAITTTGSAVSPGDNAPGILSAQGSATIDAASTFKVALNGATAGTGYSQLDVKGSVSLATGTLSASLGFTPTSGENFTIIQCTAPIVGTFAGLPQGASVTIGEVRLTINYDADGGDAVVLTQAATTSTPTLTGTTTSLKSSANPSLPGQTVTFTAIVAPTSGSSTPIGIVTFTVDGHAQTPVALAVVNGVDEASFTTTALTAGNHTIGATYNGTPDFATSQAIPHAQSVSASVTTPPPSTDGPRITLVQRYGYHMGQTSIVLTFDQALDAVTAEDVKDYRIIGPAGRAIAIRKAMYDPAALTVTLHTVERISIHHPYKLIVDGTAPRGLTNTKGQLLDGANRGSPDSNYRAPLTWRNLVVDPLPEGWHASKT